MLHSYLFQKCTEQSLFEISMFMNNTNTFNFEITEDFIGVFNNAFPAEMCDKYIKYYEELEVNGLVRARDSNAKIPKHMISDTSHDLITGSWTKDVRIHYVNHDFNACFWAFCYPEDSKKYSILSEFGEHKIYDIKIQKTEPGEGYHRWHTEAAERQHCTRLFAFMLYLNDIDDGGETEFLYLKKRFKPTKNQLLLWPAGFTHTHRGNPPLTESKYVITGWIEF